MQVKSWPTPVSAIISNHLWFLRFPSEKQKNASRKNLFRLEAPWPRREIQPWGLSTVTRTLTYGNYALLYLMEFALSVNFFGQALPGGAAAAHPPRSAPLRRRMVVSGPVFANSSRLWAPGISGCTGWGRAALNGESAMTHS